MRNLLLVLCLAVGGCQSDLRRVDFPAERESDWITSGPRGSATVYAAPTDGQLRAFAEDERPVRAIRVAIGADDLYGSKLYDGFDFLLQPLDADGRTVRKLGKLTLILHKFELDTLDAKGRELMRWHVPASRMAGLWKDGGVNEGYHMKLVWTRGPTARFVRMEAHFTTLTGETFTELKTESIDQPRYRWLKK